MYVLIYNDRWFGVCFLHWECDIIPTDEVTFFGVDTTTHGRNIWSTGIMVNPLGVQSHPPIRQLSNASWRRSPMGFICFMVYSRWTKWVTTYPILPPKNPTHPTLRRSWSSNLWRPFRRPVLGTFRGCHVRWSHEENLGSSGDSWRQNERNEAWNSEKWR